ncbi:hypothetical protein M0813_28331 [Anaeramoeba flamelloides]|uniref:Calponin-homology (CH) domain-containing protein n=1 Tax=Anaeramoeba flamelloides TaxID=1746091 RepID=A0ABQ8XUM2_9EUKA|nr:hypothetical protein M0813_28331 [Anaeramoeba flamelloides]
MSISENTYLEWISSVSSTKITNLEILYDGVLILGVLSAITKTEIKVGGDQKKSNFEIIYKDLQLFYLQKMNHSPKLDKISELTNERNLNSLKKVLSYLFLASQLGSTKEFYNKKLDELTLGAQEELKKYKSTFLQEEDVNLTSVNLTEEKENEKKKFAKTTNETEEHKEEKNDRVSTSDHETEKNFKPIILQNNKNEQKKLKGKKKTAMGNKKVKQPQVLKKTRSKKPKRKITKGNQKNQNEKEIKKQSIPKKKNDQIDKKPNKQVKPKKESQNSKKCNKEQIEIENLKQKIKFLEQDQKKMKNKYLTVNNELQQSNKIKNILNTRYNNLVKENKKNENEIANSKKQNEELKKILLEVKQNFSEKFKITLKKKPENKQITATELSQFFNEIQKEFEKKNELFTKDGQGAKNQNIGNKTDYKKKQKNDSDIDTEIQKKYKKIIIQKNLSLKEFASKNKQKTIKINELIRQKNQMVDKFEQLKKISREEKEKYSKRIEDLQSEVNSSIRLNLNHNKHSNENNNDENRQKQINSINTMIKVYTQQNLEKNQKINQLIEKNKIIIEKFHKLKSFYTERNKLSTTEMNKLKQEIIKLKKLSSSSSSLKPRNQNRNQDQNLNKNKNKKSNTNEDNKNITNQSQNIQLKRQVKKLNQDNKKLKIIVKKSKQKNVQKDELIKKLKIQINATSKKAKTKIEKINQLIKKNNLMVDKYRKIRIQLIKLEKENENQKLNKKHSTIIGNKDI